MKPCCTSAWLYVLALRDGLLCLDGERLLLGLLHPGQCLGGVDAREQLAGARGIAFAHDEVTQLARDAP